MVLLMSYVVISTTLLTVVTIFTEKKRLTSTPAGDLFFLCLLANFAAIFFEALSAASLATPQHFSVIARLILKTLAYLTSLTMVPLYTGYMIGEMFAKYKGGKLARTLNYAQLTLYALNVLFLLSNFFLEQVFAFDLAGNFTLGRFWYFNYIYLAFNALVCLCLTISHRADTFYDSVRLGLSTVFVLPALVVVKGFMPHIPIDGLLGAFIAVVIFLSFQSRNVGKDSLTRLDNQNAFTKEVNYRAENGHALRLVLIALRSFDMLDTIVGYEKGDEALINLGTWLRNNYPTDDIYRFSPTTFAVLFRDPAAGGDERIHKLIDSFPGAKLLPRENFPITAHFADLHMAAGTYNATRVVECLNYAKKQLRNSEADHLHFTDALLADLSKRKHLVEYLHQAINENLFDVWYQPIFCLETGTFDTCEALVRLKDPNGKFISPAEFIPVAEDAGLVADINQKVIEKVCAFLGANPDLPISSASVNLSLRQLQIPDFADQLAACINAYHLPKGKVALEITERMLVEQESPEYAVLNKLFDADYCFLLDDFGTGFSNFTSTLKYPLAKIKLDRSFISDSDPRNMAVAKMLIDLFHQNAQKVVVEGVETFAQQKFFADNHVDFIQGYYYARPMPEADYVNFLINQTKQTA